MQKIKKLNYEQKKNLKNSVINISSTGGIQTKRQSQQPTKIYQFIVMLFATLCA